jgi:hypothetical protein
LIAGIFLSIFFMSFHPSILIETIIYKKTMFHQYKIRNEKEILV